VKLWTELVRLGKKMLNWLMHTMWEL